MTRFGRRLEVEQLRAELPLNAFFFDLLYRDGESIIDAPLAERLSKLDDVIPGVDARAAHHHGERRRRPSAFRRMRSSADTRA